jgi:hypothetical protein
MAMAGLTWLHLSDWHQKGMEFDRKVVRDALLEDIKKRLDIHPDLENLDFIVFSGDLAFSGKKEEYKAAQKYLLDPLMDASNLDKSRPKVTIETGTSGDCIIIPAGASYDRRTAAYPQYNNAYNFVHLDFANNKGAVYLRCWSDRLNKWREDIDAYKDGCFVFSLPKGLSTGTDITSPAGIGLGDKQSSIVMTADIKIIEQIEKQIGKELKPLPLKNIMNLDNNGYVLDHAGQVQRLNLDGTKVKDISILRNCFLTVPVSSTL